MCWQVRIQTTYTTEPFRPDFGMELSFMLFQVPGHRWCRDEQQRCKDAKLKSFPGQAGHRRRIAPLRMIRGLQRFSFSRFRS